MKIIYKCKYNHPLDILIILTCFGILKYTVKTGFTSVLKEVVEISTVNFYQTMNLIKKLLIFINKLDLINSHIILLYYFNVLTIY